MSKDLIKPTRGLSSEMNKLQANELGFATDTKQLFIGTGDGAEPTLIKGEQYANATHEVAGLMSAMDKTNVDNMYERLKPFLSLPFLTIVGGYSGYIADGSEGTSNKLCYIKMVSAGGSSIEVQIPYESGTGYYSRTINLVQRNSDDTYSAYSSGSHETMLCRCRSQGSSSSEYEVLTAV